LLVPLVEEGWVEHPVTEQIAKIYLEDLFGDGFQSADVLVLGCTHYPLIKPILQRVAPTHVAIIDSAESTAQAVKDLLQRTPLQVPSKEQSQGAPRLKFFATDSVEKFHRLGARFLGRPIEDVEHADLKE
jgi:glutamate racemase